MIKGLRFDLARSALPWVALIPIALLIGKASTTFALRPKLLLAALLGLVLILFGIASLYHPMAFVLVFLISFITLPPFYLSPSSQTPFFVPWLLLPVGLAIVVARFADFNFRADALAVGLGMFLAGTGLSLPFAYWLSGPEVATQSLFRWLMLAQTALVYLLVRGGGSWRESKAERWFVPALVVAAGISAAYGVLDFFWPIPIPHPSAEQHIWLGTEVLRRAQGVFYEASNFGNFCAFFLVVVSAAFVARRERALRIPRASLFPLILVLSFAVFLSFSRSVWGSSVVALLVFAMVVGRVRTRRLLVFFLALGIALGVLWALAPELWDYMLRARLGNLAQIFEDPNLASSGRLQTWARGLEILRDNPQFVLFGVGYKTLPYTRLFGDEIITDNGYLNLLLETGLIGLVGFVAFSVAVFKTFLRVARSAEPATAFWGALIFSFWCGEWVLMMAADSYTYWRNMAVFVALMAFTLNRAEREARFNSRPALAAGDVERGP